MGDFVELVEDNDWPNLPDPPLLDDERLAMRGIYYQDRFEPQPVVVARSNTHNKYTVLSANSDYLSRSSFWFSDATQRKDILPFAVAGLAVIVTPSLDLGATTGQAVAAAYFAGLLTNYVILRLQGDRSTVKKLKVLH